MEQQKTKKNISRDVRMVIGVSITLLLLALIAVIVAVAIHTTVRVSHLYSATYLFVDDEVIDGRYIAVRSDGTYSLMEGEIELAGGFAQLKRGIGCYEFVTQKGGTGVLNMRGKKMGEISREQVAGYFSLTVGRQAYTAGVIEDGATKYYTYLWTGEKISELDGYEKASYLDGKYFFVESGSNIVFDDGTTYDGYAAGQWLARADNDSYLITDGTNGTLISGDSVKSGRLVSREINAENPILYFTIGGEPYYYDLTPADFNGVDGTVVEYDGNYYYIKGSTVFSADGKALYTGDNTLTSVKAGYVKDGDKIVNISGETVISGIIRAVSSPLGSDGKPSAVDEAYVFETDKGLQSLGGTVLNSVQLSNYGGIRYEQNVIYCDGSYVVPYVEGWYFTADGTFLPRTVGAQLEQIGAAGSAVVVCASGDRVMSIKAGKRNANTVATRYASGGFSIAISGNRCVITKKAGGGKGVINEGGKVIIEPFYDEAVLYSSYIFVRRDGAWAVASASGELVTDLCYVSQPDALGEYILCPLPGGGSELINVYGSTVIERVMGMEVIDAYTADGFGKVPDERHYYAKLLTGRGYRVMRIPVAYL